MDESSEHLAIYLERIHSFLISNDETQVFLFLTLSIEDVLVNIAKDTNFLKQGKFNDNCKSLADKLLMVLDKNKEVFTLDYEIKNGDEKNNNNIYRVIIYKKIPVPAFKDPVSLPSKPLRKPNSIQAKTEGNTSKSVMSSFKTTFLNATLKFVKDDSQMVLQYPNMSSEQADFVKQMIDQCMERDGTKAGFKGLYDPLAEALKIFSLKYEFKLHVETLGDMKRLKFEKTRKFTDSSVNEVTKITKEETDSDSSLNLVAKSKSQSILSTLTEAMGQTTPEFKLRTLTKLKDFLKEKNISNHTFLNLNQYEQQFITHWQTLTRRVEVIKMLDVQGQMVLDEIRDCLKNKNYRVKVELGVVTSTQKRYAKLTKVLNPYKVKLSKEEKAARLEAMVLPTMSAACAAGLNSGNSNSNSSLSSNASNLKPQTNREKQIEKFFLKTKRIRQDWIQDTMIKIRKFLQDEAEASLLIRSITEVQMALLTKWQNVLMEPEVIKTFPSDVQVILHDIRNSLKDIKGKFRVDFEVTKIKAGQRDARFIKRPDFNSQPVQTKKNVSMNIPPKSKVKTENNLDSGTDLTKTPNVNVPVNIPPNGERNKGKVSSEMAAVPKTANTVAPVKLEPKKGENKGAVSSKKAAVSNIAKLATSVNYETKENWKNVEIFVEKAAAVPKKINLAAPVKFEPKTSENKAIPPENATITRDAKEPRSISIANLYRIMCKKIKTAENNRRNVTQAPIHKSSSLTSWDKKDRKTVKLPAATVKLIQGLNQPLVSERGLKMMRQMGWEGGALGARGEGIVEPIMPPLDLGKRAGLGAPKPNIKVLLASSKSSTAMAVDRNDLKRDVMQTLLRMVKGEEAKKTEIKFTSKLTLSDWNYVKFIAKTFNNRDLVPPSMSEVLENVTDDELMLTACWSWSKTNVLLLLSKYYETTDIESDEWAFVAFVRETLSKKRFKKLDILRKPDSAISKAVKNSSESVVTSRGDIYVRSSPKPVMVEGQDFKCYVLAQILDFCLNCNAKRPSIKEISQDVILKGTMVKKQLSYIQDAVRRISKGARCSSNAPNENALHEEILSAMQGKGYNMTVEFPSFEVRDGKPVHNIITLTKIFDDVSTKNDRFPLKTEANKTNNNCSSKANKNLQLYEDILEREMTKNAPKHFIKDTDNAHKTNDVKTADNKVDNSNNINANPNNTNVDKTFTNNKEINNKSEIEKNTQECDYNNKDCLCCNNLAMVKNDKLRDDDLGNKHNKADKKDIHSDATNKRKTANEEKVSVDYIILETQITETVNAIQDTNSLKGKNDMDYKTDETKDVIKIKNDNNPIQLKTAESESVKTNIAIDIYSSALNNEKNETNEYDKASQLMKSIEKAGMQMMIENITDKSLQPVETCETEKTALAYEIKRLSNESDKTSQLITSIENIDSNINNAMNNTKNFKPFETEKTAVLCQIKLETNENAMQLIKNIDDVANKSCNVTNKNESSEAAETVKTDGTEKIYETEKTALLCHFDKETVRSIVEEETPINDIITSLIDIKIAEKTASDKVINDVKYVAIEIPIEDSEENNEKTQKLERLGKRIRSKAQSSDRAHKRTKYDFMKHINIAPKDYPQTKMTKKMAAEIQKSILNSIDYTQVLPLLKCHGIQDGALSYSCHNVKSFEIIQNVVKPFDLNVTLTEENEKGTWKMSFMMNTFIDESVDATFKSLEQFNLGLSTKDWVLVKKEQYSDFIVIFVDVDVDSFKFIQGENFQLYAGIDEARFTIVWG